MKKLIVVLLVLLGATSIGSVANLGFKIGYKKGFSEGRIDGCAAILLKSIKSQLGEPPPELMEQIQQKMHDGCEKLLAE